MPSHSSQMGRMGWHRQKLSKMSGESSPFSSLLTSSSLENPFLALSLALSLLIVVVKSVLGCIAVVLWMVKVNYGGFFVLTHPIVCEDFILVREKLVKGLKV